MERNGEVTPSGNNNQEQDGRESSASSSMGYSSSTSSESELSDDNAPPMPPAQPEPNRENPPLMPELNRREAAGFRLQPRFARDRFNEMPAELNPDAGDSPRTPEEGVNNVPLPPPPPLPPVNNEEIQMPNLEDDGVVPLGGLPAMPDNLGDNGQPPRMPPRNNRRPEDFGENWEARFRDGNHNGQGRGR